MGSGIPIRQEWLIQRSNGPTHAMRAPKKEQRGFFLARRAVIDRSAAGAMASPLPSVELQVTVRRLQGSLGFGVDKNNIVVVMKPDGAAVRDSLLQRGDQVVAVDGRLLGGRNMAQEIQPDESVFMLTVIRRDPTLCTSVDRLPSKHPAASKDALLHLARAIVTRGGKEPLGLEMTSSNVVKRLLENGPAMRGGIQLADVVVAVNGTWLGDRRVVDVLARAAASPIAFTVVRAECRQESDAGADVVEHSRQRGLQPPPLGPPPAMLLVEEEHYQLADPCARPPDFPAVAMRDQSQVSVRQADGRNIDACARAMREAKFWRALSPRGVKPCSAILAFYGQQLVAGSLYTVTEPYIETLAAAFRRRPDMPPAQIRGVATDLMRGLAHMHDTCRLVHCNIGLDTLAQCANGAWKILSFSSVARPTGVRASCAHVIETSANVPYVSLAPELVDESGEAHVGSEVDLWAAGIVLAALLNRREPPLVEPHELTLPAVGGDATANVLRESAGLCLEAEPSRRPRAAELLSYLTHRTAGQVEELVELRLHVLVKRGTKGLGIGVNRGNVIQSLTAGHVLQLGDEIVSVDGVDIAGRHLAHVIKPEAPTYSLVVVRRDQVIGMTMRRLPADHPVLRPKARLQVLHAVILRDQHGLGLGLTPNNVVERIKPGGAAERCGLLHLNDVVIAVDGESIGARSAVHAIKPDSFETAFDVLRAAPVGPVRVVLRPPARAQTVSKLRELGGPDEDLSSRSSQLNLATSRGDGEAGLEQPARHSGDPSSAVPLAAKPSQGALADVAPAEVDPLAEPSDTQLLDFLIGLQGFDRASLVDMYRNSAQSRAAARAEAADKHSAIMRQMAGGLNGAEAMEIRDSEDGVPSEPGILDVFSRARQLLESNLGGTGSNGATFGGDLGRGEAPALAQPAHGTGHGGAESPAQSAQKLSNGEAAADACEAEPLAVRIQRLLTQSSDDLSSPEKMEMTSLEKDELTPHAGSEMDASARAMDEDVAGQEGAGPTHMADEAAAPLAPAESGEDDHDAQNEAEETQPQAERF